MKGKKIVAMLLALVLVLGLMMVPVQAMEVPEGAPEGVTAVFKVAVDGNTRNEDWKDAETGIISLPLGTEFDNGGTNHGVYWLYSPVEMDQTFYVYWVINVEENDDLDDQIIVSHDPSWLQSYGPNAGENEVEVSIPIADTFLLDDFDGSDLYYSDIEPDKWQIFGGGFTVTNENVAFVQHRLHYKNQAAMQVKYLVVTSEPMEFVVNEETGEIDGVTNSNPIAVPTPTPEATPTPDPTTPPATTAPATTEPAAEKTDAPATSAPATTADTDTQSDDGGNNIGLIIGIVAAVVVVVVIVVVVVAKKKK